MNETFLVFCLPRSRTAWLSTLLSYGSDCFCWHAPFVESGSFEDGMKVIGSAESHVIGSVDPSQVLFAPALIAALGKPRLLFVRRPLEDVARSFARVSRDYSVDAAMKSFVAVEEALDAVSRQYSGTLPALSVNYHELDSEQTIRQIWSHCTAGSPFPREHWSKLQRLHVEMRGAYLEGMTQRMQGWN